MAPQQKVYILVYHWEMVYRGDTMKKILISILALMILTAVVVAAEKINLRSIGYDEVAYAGTEIPVFVAIKNIGDSKLEDVQVKIDSPDLDIFSVSHSVDIRRTDYESYVLLVYIPQDTPAGDYTLRIRVSDDQDEKRTYYRFISIR